MSSSGTILYFHTSSGDPVQQTTIAGIRRYCAVRDWAAEAIPVRQSVPSQVPKVLAAHRPVAGCVVENGEDRVRLPPDLFGTVPVIYLHASESLYGRDAVRIVNDNEAIARAAFRELSAGRPPACAVVGFFMPDLAWTTARERVFAALSAEAGIPCFVFPHFATPRDTRPARLAKFKKARIAHLAKWVATLPRHTAIFVVNDETALEVVAAAQKAHRAIPRELTLCGVDNVTSLCEAASPTVSSVQIDHERAGYMAARMIGEKTAGVATIGPMLVVRRESTSGRGRRDRFILDAIERIRREACDGLTAADVASSYPGSRRTFERRFREAAGHSVLDEIMHVRLERVFAMLSHREKLLGTIADFCGFGCEYELRKVFRARTGMSMREWRKRHLG